MWCEYQNCTTKQIQGVERNGCFSHRNTGWSLWCGASLRSLTPESASWCCTPPDDALPSVSPHPIFQCFSSAFCLLLLFVPQIQGVDGEGGMEVSRKISHPSAYPRHQPHSSSWMGQLCDYLSMCRPYSLANTLGWWEPEATSRAGLVPSSPSLNPSQRKALHLQEGSPPLPYTHLHHTITRFQGF